LSIVKRVVTVVDWW